MWFRQETSVLAGPLATLALLSSCVPLARSEPAGTRVTMAVPDPDRRLLHRLDLDASWRDGAAATAAQASPEGAAPAFVASAGADDSERAQRCLSAAVYYEARSEPVDGQRAVAQVVLNRVRDRAFPASVCGVVYQHSRAGCQFTFACDGSTVRPVEPVAWRRAEEVAAGALAGGVYAPVGAATHYHAAYVSPWWAPSLFRIGAVGSHVFYRWRDHLADTLSFRQRYAGEEPAGNLASPVTIAATGGSNEAGVAVHRLGEEAAANTAIVAVPDDAPHPGFGVRVHRGEAAAFGVSVSRGNAGPAPASEATMSS